MTLGGSCISPVSKRICLRAFFTAMERHLSCTNYRYDEFSGEFAVRLAHKPILRLDTRVFAIISNRIRRLTYIRHHAHYLL